MLQPRGGTLVASDRRSWLEVLGRHAAERGDRVAFGYLEDSEIPRWSITYMELERRARAIAAELQLRGHAEERALLLFPPGIEFITAFFGCLYAGVTAIPVFPPRRNRKMQRLQAIARDARAAVALTCDRAQLGAGAGRNDGDQLSGISWIHVNSVDDLLAEQWQAPQVESATVAMLQYTSGSTGTPRGVILSHGNLVHNCRVIQHGFGTTPDDVGLSWLPAYHDMGLVGCILHTVFLGSLTYLMSPTAFLQRPSRWLHAISRFRVSVSGGPNFGYDLCAKKITNEELVGVDLSCWQVAFNGAEPVRESTLRRFIDRFASVGFRAESFYPCYGLAESTLMITGGRRHEPHVAKPFANSLLQVETDQGGDGVPERYCTLVSSGVRQDPEDGMLRIVDPESQEVLPENRVGEIWVHSASVGQGYFDQPEVSDAVFRARLNPDDGRTYLRTGDLGLMDQGELYVIGRIKDVIVCRGVNHYPQDIESTVEQLGIGLRLGSAAAFAIETTAGEQLVVVVEPERSTETDFVSICRSVHAAVVAAHEVQLSSVVLVRAGSTPKTSSGKIQRYACRQAFLERTLASVHEWHLSGDPRATLSTPDGGPALGGSPSAVDGCPVAGNGRPRPLEEVRRDTTLESVYRAVRRVAGERATELRPTTSILELGLDSLERLEIANHLETEYGGVFPEETLVAMETCQQVAEAIERHLLGPRLALSGPSEIPESYYRVESFPEYQQLRRSMEAVRGRAQANPYFRAYEGVSRDTTVFEDRELIQFSSYNYLGLSGHPVVSHASCAAIEHYGTSVSASRLVSGERRLHRELERELAAFLGCDDALVFVGGHATNVTTIGHLLGPGDLILHDSLAHNSIVQGALLSGAQRRPFPHNDWVALERTLDQLRGGFRRVLIAIEGAYSMDGDFPDLPRFIDLRERYRALLLVDEAHSIGTMGATGRGIGEHFSVDRSAVDIWMGTLSKALGSCGGYIAGRVELVEYLKYTAPGFVYSVGLPPSLAAAALAALRVIAAEPSRVSRCQTRAAKFLELAQAAGLNTGTSGATPIVPVILGNSRATLELSERLLGRGIAVHPILHPAVEEAGARLRFFITSEHTDSQIRRAVRVLSEESAKVRFVSPADGTAPFAHDAAAQAKHANHRAVLSHFTMDPSVTHRKAANS